MPKNIVAKKSAKVLMKKKTRLNKEEHDHDDEDIVFDEDVVVIPDAENVTALLPSYDTK